jgi:hypothetical protein
MVGFSGVSPKEVNPRVFEPWGNNVVGNHHFSNGVGTLKVHCCNAKCAAQGYKLEDRCMFKP